MGDWIKLHRAMLTSSLWYGTMRSEVQLRIAIGLLLCAAWRAGGRSVCPNCGKVEEVPIGGFAFGAHECRRVLAIEKIASVSATKRAFRRLCELGFMKRANADQCHSLYVIENFALYQDKLDDPDQARTKGEPSPDQARTKPEPRPGHQREEELRSSKNTKNDNTTQADKRPGEQEPLALASPKPSDDGERWAAVEALRRSLLALDSGHTCASPQWRGKFAWKKALDKALDGGASLDRIRTAIDRWPSDDWLSGRIDGARKINGMGDLLRHVDRLGADVPRTGAGRVICEDDERWEQLAREGGVIP